MSNIAGHTFLARLGKKRLRPGGIQATKWLMAKSQIKKGNHILEVACNMGTTLFDISKKHEITAVGIDIDDQALLKAKQYAEKLHLKNKLTFIVGDATQLPFDDDSFDIVINEAMLTMLSIKQKEKALQEYYRVLKPNGILLTHDVCLNQDDEDINRQIQSDLSKNIQITVQPLTKSSWLNLLSKAQFNRISYQTGKVTLLKPFGMIKDEGLINALKLMKHALKKENRKRFFSLYKTFKRHDKQISYIVTASTK